MIQVQFRITVQTETNFVVDYDILRREDANDLEYQLAEKLQEQWLLAFHRAAEKAGLKLNKTVIEDAI